MTRKREKRQSGTDALTAGLEAEQMHGLHAALARVGKNPDELFSWLQDIAVRKIVTDSDLSAACFQMNAFHLVHAAERAKSGLDQPERPIQPGERFELLPIRRTDVLDVQRYVRECFASLRTRAHWDLPMPVHLGVHWNKPAKGGNGMVLSTVLGDGKAAFLVELRALLTDVRHQLRQCSAPGCDRLFLARRGTMNYCGRTCQNRAAQIRFRKGRQKELSERRHKRYERRVRERHPRAKVARRPRA
jgi:hypothetical protein